MVDLGEGSPTRAAASHLPLAARCPVWVTMELKIGQSFLAGEGGLSSQLQETSASAAEQTHRKWPLQGSLPCRGGAGQAHPTVIKPASWELSPAPRLPALGPQTPNTLGMHTNTYIHVHACRQGGRAKCGLETLVCSPHFKDTEMKAQRWPGSHPQSHSQTSLPPPIAPLSSSQSAAGGNTHPLTFAKPS